VASAAGHDLRWGDGEQQRRGVMTFTFSVDVDASLTDVWDFLIKPENLPKWDVGTESAGYLKTNRKKWEIVLKPFISGTPFITLLGEPTVNEAEHSVTTEWRYDDGTFAVQDGWRVVETNGVRRITYTLERYRLRGWRAWVQWVVGPCIVDPALNSFMTKDIGKLKNNLNPSPSNGGRMRL